MAQQTTIPVPPLTINWVPEGFKWSPEAANKALAKGAFLRVGGQGVTRRFLSGAKRSWASADPNENRTVFHTNYRITGTPENIRIALHYAGVPDQDIDQVLATAITSTNWQTTMANAVAEELARRDALKQEKPTGQAGYDLNQLLWFYQNLKTAVIASKSGEQGTRVTSPGRVGPSKTLAEKIRELGEGKVLDVSNMDLATGKGVRSIYAPKTNRSGKFGALVNGRYNVPIISNNIEKYARAIELAYPGEAQRFAQDVEIVRQGLLLTGANAGAGVATFPNVAPAPFAGQKMTLGTGSPSRVAGATIAPAPVFTAAGTGVPKVASPTRVATVGGANLPPIPALGGLLRQ